MKIHRLILLAVILSGLSYFFLDPLIAERVSVFPLEYRGYLKKISFLLSPPFHLFFWPLLFCLIRYRTKSSFWSKRLFHLVVSQVLSVGVIRTLAKVFLGRARPEIYLSDQIYGFFGFSLDHHYQAFPSGHAVAIFTLIASASTAFPKSGVYLYPIGFILALSRVLLNYHFLSDVLAGACIGIVASKTTTLMINKGYIKRVLRIEA